MAAAKPLNVSDEVMRRFGDEVIIAELGVAFKCVDFVEELCTFIDTECVRQHLKALIEMNIDQAHLLRKMLADVEMRSGGAHPFLEALPEEVPDARGE